MSSPSEARDEAPEEVDFGVFGGFENQFFFTNTSSAILTYSFNDFAFVLDTTVLARIGLNHRNEEARWG